MIVIIDFGSQYTQLIARRIREQNVYCEIHPCNTPLDTIQGLSPEGIILSGGPNSVYGDDAPRIDPVVFEWGIPILGICYGLQLIALLLGGNVQGSDHSEYGRTEIEFNPDCPLFRNLPQDRTLTVWMSHGDQVTQPPAGFKAQGHSSNAPFVVLSDPEKRLYGLQFHPEVTHTEHGTQILRNFVFAICGCRPDWDMASFLESKIQELQETVGSRKVLCALSGGVDSTVTAVLLHKAIGDQLTCILVNNGLLRKGEAERVIDLFRRHYHIDLRYEDASDLFLDKLSGVIDPEEKRRIIGNTFIDVFEKAAAVMKDTHLLAQGTLYPDVIESVSFKGPSAVIKSHHNVGGLPEKMKMTLIEPLRELFKDEVRELGKTLGLDDELVYRHPFPGPGLAIRILGAVDRERLAVLREADRIVMDEIKKAGWYRDVWQSFAVLLPVRSVGVMGDARTYEWTVAVRCVNSIDAMTADWVPIPYPLLGRISNRIINEVKKVNRVVYDITSKPPGTIEWE
jgi:GMP synthase (glutamine-hydrolysing)